MKIEDGTYKTKAGSTVTINGGRCAVEFDWFEEDNACFDCVVEPHPIRSGHNFLLIWCCDECDGGSAKLTKCQPVGEKVKESAA